MTNHLTHKLFLLAAISWAGLIYLLSDQPGMDVIPLFPGQDKVFHAIVFGVLGFLVLGAMHTGANGYSPTQVWTAVVLTAIYGMLDEFHQRFVPGRTADTWDVVADTSGAMLGIYVLYALTRLRLRRSG
jgi:VanZ family protein